ncbi:MAG TPA: amidohydrolase family protein [Woeseiaceae bacterium]|nr:amidohydrolase family protein [Woeseiaceae bacterium]
MPNHALALAGVLAAVLLPAAPARSDTTAFVNVNVVPMHTETVLPAQTVIVIGGRIAEVGAAADVPVPDGATRIDGSDRYLMPGLAEMHAHVPPAGADSLERVLNLYVANGVTLARGMLGEPGHLVLRQQLQDGAVLGPRLLTSGPSFSGNSVSGPAQARDMVREQRAAGYDFLKIHPGLTAEEFEAIAAAAAEAGIPFAGHVPAAVGLRRALSLGIATVDHLDGYLQALVPATDGPPGGVAGADEGFFGLYLADAADTHRIDAIVAATRKAGTWNVPTQSLFVHWLSADSPDDMRAWPEMQYMPAATVDQWAAAKAATTGEPGYSVELVDRAIDLRRRIIKALHDADAGLLLGSDAPQVFNVPGFSIHRELAYMVDAGLTPYEALQAGTVAPARFFGKEAAWGTVEAGREADLVLLDANPLADISATREIRGVMVRGRWIPREEIAAMLAALAE